MSTQPNDPTASTASTSASASTSTYTPHRSAFLRSASVPTLEKSPPKLTPRWLHAEGKNWTPFGIGDSTRLEEGWHVWRSEDVTPRSGDAGAAGKGNDADAAADAAATPPPPPPTLPEADPTQPLPSWRVPVGEDRMFEVDLRPRDHPRMYPVFWKAPSVDVRRGEWFFESSRLAPCEADLSRELSALYAAIQPWTSAYADELRASASIGAEGEEKLKCPLHSLKGSYVIFSGSHLARIYQEGVSNRLAKTFFTAWAGEHGGGTLVVRGYDQMQKLLKARKGDTKKVRTTGGGANRKSGIVTAAALGPYAHPASSGTATPTSKAATATVTAAASASASARSSGESERGKQRGRANGDESPLPAGAAQPQDTGLPPAGTAPDPGNAPTPTTTAPTSTSTPPSNTADIWSSLTSKLGAWTSANASPALSAKAQRDVAESFKEARARVQDGEEEEEQQQPQSPSQTKAQVRTSEEVPHTDADTADAAGDDDEAEEWQREREANAEAVELVICWHGIGQKMAEEWKSLEFSIAVNAFRGLVRKKAKSTPGFRSLTQGKRLAFIPINWRATLDDFEPTREEGGGEDEHDAEEHLDNRVGLEDLFGTSDSIPLARSVTKNLLLDIPLFLSHHRPEVLRRCVAETNRAYALFCARNPSFRRQEGGPRVSMICHSLGAALAMDILSAQPTCVDAQAPLRDVLASKALAYNTHNLFLLGSPAALFFYLQSRQLIARRGREGTRAAAAAAAARKDVALARPLWGCLSADRIWNIFNPTDPISTCLNGCVDARAARGMDAVRAEKVVAAYMGAIGGGGGEKKRGGAAEAEAEGQAGAEKKQKKKEAARGHEKKSSADTSGTALGLFGTWSRKGGASTAAAAGATPPDLEDAPVGEAQPGAEAGDKKAEVKGKRQSWAERLASTTRKRASREVERVRGGAAAAAAAAQAPAQTGKEGEGDAQDESKAEGDVSCVAREEEAEKRGVEAEKARDANSYPPPPPPRAAAPPSEGEGKEEGGEREESSKEEEEEEGEAKREASSKEEEEEGEAKREASSKSTSSSPRSSHHTTRASLRFLALNPLAHIDYVLPRAPPSLCLPFGMGVGVSASSFVGPAAQWLEYAGMFAAHATYWSNECLAEVVLVASEGGPERSEGTRGSGEESGGTHWGRGSTWERVRGELFPASEREGSGSSEGPGEGAGGKRQGDAAAVQAPRHG